MSVSVPAHLKPESCRRDYTGRTQQGSVPDKQRPSGLAGQQGEAVVLKGARPAFQRIQLLNRIYGNDTPVHWVEHSKI